MESGAWPLRVVAPAIRAALWITQRQSGRLTLPQAGAVLVVCNHTCHLDPVTIGKAVFEAGRIPRFAARADLFALPLLGWALRASGQIPVYRRDVLHNPNDGGTAASSYKALGDALDRGECVVIFPEGSFTRDPARWPMDGKTGAARLAAQHPDAVVVPVAHWGNEGIVEPFVNRFHPRTLGRWRTEVMLAQGEALRLAGRDAREDTAAIMDAITELVEGLRQRDGSAGSGPTRPRWNVARDGDPFASIVRRKQEKVARRLGALPRR